MPIGSVSHDAFSRAVITSRFGDGPAAEYLSAYLADIGAASFLAESHYVDRHYIEDFAQHYARSFDAPELWCARLHFFSLADAKLETILQDAYLSPSGRKTAEGELQRSYLGFVVQRPLAIAPIGRTVLATYRPEGRRRYEVVRKYRVNAAGLHLEIEGLAYQQQDGGAAVCASTALWSALQAVARLAGHRTPTPSAITRSARNPFPASAGLDLRDMAEALSALGYVADTFSPGANRPAFRARIVTCLRSRLPVILLLSQKFESGAGKAAGLVEDGHAVCVTGFSEPSDVAEVSPPLLSTPPIPPIRTRDASVKIVYVHDDNLGSHAHYELEDSDEADDNGCKKLVLFRGRSDKANPPWWPGDRWIVQCALVPKPSKLRMPSEAVMQDVLALRHVFEDIFGVTLEFSARFDTGVRYKGALTEDQAWGLPNPLDFTSMRAFQGVLSLPRYVGVISISDAQGLLCEVITDVSDALHSAGPSVLGIVAPRVEVGSPAWNKISVAATLLYRRCPVIGAAAGAA